MIKLLIFDLDGTLADLKEIHYTALNNALSQVGAEIISEEEHYSIYDGLSTDQKLKLLTQKRGLATAYYEKIQEFKQQETISEIRRNIHINNSLISLFNQLRKDGFKIYVASNSIRETIRVALSKLGLLEYVDRYLSNEDVKLKKPSPEIYMRCMIEAGYKPSETLIFEDSVIGREGAVASGAYLFPVEKLSDVNYENIGKEINKLNNVKKKENVSKRWKSNSLNIVVPMSGHGSRFKEANFSFPKPLISVIDNKPMIQMVVESLNIDAHYIFIVQTEHRTKYGLDAMLNILCPGCDIIETDVVTEGAACSVLLSQKLIDNDKQLLICNSDQIIKYNSADFFYNVLEKKLDAGILSFESIHPKWSYASLDEEGFVNRVAEKDVISNHATVGVYWSRTGSMFVRYAKEMIAANKRVKNEFYVAPVFNEYIADGKKIKIWDVEEMNGIGDPESLNDFLRRQS